MKTFAWFSLIALFCILYYPFAAVFLHFIRTDLNPITTFLSVYALGESGTLLSVGLLLRGLSEFILSIQISRTTKKASNLGRCLLFICGIAACMGGIFREGAIHNISGFQYILFPIAVLLIGAKQRNTSERNFSIAIGILTLILIVLLLSTGSGDPFNMNGIKGLIQRFNICAVTLWLGLSAWNVYRMSKTAFSSLHT